ncbi:uncharacterized transporter YutK-like [Haliotis cracherodii]|uniref:uncharacterized transporter YutK-like n=1 Tax=Haliotis cracherodii TaxID=6455 RepID=UPI0039EBA60F
MSERRITWGDTPLTRMVYGSGQDLSDLTENVAPSRQASEMVKGRASNRPQRATYRTQVSAPAAFVNRAFKQDSEKRPNFKSVLSEGSDDVFYAQHDIIISMERPRVEDFIAQSACSRVTLRIQNSAVKFVISNKSVLKRLCLVIGLLLFFVYLGYAMYFEFGDDGSIRLLVCAILGVLLLAHASLSEFTSLLLDRCYCLCGRNRLVARITRRSLYVVAVVSIALTLGLVVGRESPSNLRSLPGIAVFILLTFLTSRNPARVNWHPVFWCLALMYFLALVILRLESGHAAFRFVGDRVAEFLDYTQEGAEFVFGKHFLDHRFAFATLPVIVFASACVSVLYHLEVMQVIIRVLGRCLSYCLQTTPAESVNAVSNVFLGVIEAPLMIRPFISEMTRSELHAVMTGGFATLTGSVLATCIALGVPAHHVLGACVTSAPAALAVSKLSCPETGRSRSSKEDYYRLEGGKCSNLIEAISNGASTSVKVIANVVVNVIAFLSVLKCLNVTVAWLGARVGVANLSFQLICSYVLYPVALFMGVEPGDCRAVAALIGMKTFSNELTAYNTLSGYLKNRELFENYTASYNESDWLYQNDDIVLSKWNNMTLTGGVISARSSVISTYALCGLSGVGSLGVMVGGLGALVPSRTKDIHRLVIRALVAANIASFITACTAGVLHRELC